MCIKINDNKWIAQRSTVSTIRHFNSDSAEQSSHFTFEPEERALGIVRSFALDFHKQLIASIFSFETVLHFCSFHQCLKQGS